MANPHKTFCLLNIHRRAVPMRNGEPILHTSAQPPELPSGFPRSAGYAWGAHTEIDPKHVGPPRFEWRDHNKAEATKIIGKDEQ